MISSAAEGNRSRQRSFTRNKVVLARRSEWTNPVSASTFRWCETVDCPMSTRHPDRVPPSWRQGRPQGRESLTVEAVVHPAAPPRRGDQAGVAQHPQMIGEQVPGHGHLLFDVMKERRATPA